MTTGKAIYDRRKALQAERYLRQEQQGADSRHIQDEGEILLASLAASFERIADALEQMAQNREPRR